jgi:hypothetical protein
MASDKDKLKNDPVPGDEPIPAPPPGEPEVEEEEVPKVRKALILEPVPGGALLRFRWEGGGEVPAALSGQYTSVAVGRKAAAAWVAADPDRVVVVHSKRELDEAALQERIKRDELSRI